MRDIDVYYVCLCVCVCVCVCVYWPLCTRSIFKGSLTSLNSKFFFSLTGCQTKVEEPNLPYYLHFVEGRIIICIPFPRVFAQSEKQTASSMIWTCVALSISYVDNRFITRKIQREKREKREEGNLKKSRVRGTGKKGEKMEREKVRQKEKKARWKRVGVE